MKGKFFTIKELEKKKQTDIISCLSDRRKICNDKFEIFKKNTESEIFKFESRYDWRNSNIVTFIIKEILIPKFDIYVENYPAILIRDKNTKEMLFGFSLITYGFDKTKMMLSEFKYFIEYKSDVMLERRFDILLTILSIFEDLGVDLLFPAYEFGDPQEEMLKELGFEDTNLISGVGQKVLKKSHKRKANREGRKLPINPFN